MHCQKEEKEAYANDPARGKFEGYGTKMTKKLMKRLIGLIIFFTSWLLFPGLIMICGLKILLLTGI